MCHRFMLNTNDIHCRAALYGYDFTTILLFCHFVTRHVELTLRGFSSGAAAWYPLPWFEPYKLPPPSIPGWKLPPPVIPEESRDGTMYLCLFATYQSQPLCE